MPAYLPDEGEARYREWSQKEAEAGERISSD